MILHLLYAINISIITETREQTTNTDSIHPNHNNAACAIFSRDKDGMLWHTLSIDSPLFPAPINAALFPDREGGGYNLVWNQQDGNDLKADATPLPQHQAQSQSRGWGQKQPML